MLRALSERLPRPANLGLHLIFDALVVASRVARGRIDPDRGRAKQLTRGAEGAYNHVFTGAGGGAWWCEVGDATMRWHRGAHPSPRATVRIAVSDVFELLAGRTSFVTVQMTGRLRVEGDAHAAMMFGALVGRLRDLGKSRGRGGRAARAYLDFALRRSGTGLRFEGSRP